MKKILNLKLLFLRAWKISRTYFMVTAVKSIFAALTPLINIAGLGLVINALVAGKSIENVLRIIIIYVSANLAVSLAGQVLTLWDNNVMRKSSNLLQYEYMQDCLEIDYHFVQDGKILNMKKKSMMAQPAFFLDDWGTFINYIVQFIGIFFIFFILSPIFVAVLIILSALLICLTISTQKFDYDFNNEKVDDDRKLDYLYDVMTSYKFAKEIRINNANEFIKQKYDSVFKIQINKLKQLLQKKLGINILSVFLSVAQTAIMYLYFTYQVSKGQIDIAQYTVLLASTTLFTSILLSFFSNLGTINNSLKAVEFYCEYKETINNNCIAHDSNKLSEIDIDFSSTNIKFENVSFMYPNTTEYALRDINLSIASNKKIGIVGLNGSGKTTLIKLLLRIYFPTQGKITLNGVDISKIPYNQYVSHIGVVLQDFSLFAYSLKENIVFDGENNSDRLYDSIAKSGLASKLDSLPNGVDTAIYRELNDNGIEFSGGEGQKLAMARAIYKNADLLILDEPTSALDPIAEYELFMRLNEISDGKTTIFISHRLSSTHFCDNIIVLENGRVIEQGNHTELLNQKGLYYNLFQSQAKYYEENGGE